MAYLKNHKIIFVHIPKCAGKSIEALLANHEPLRLMERKLTDSFIEENGLSNIARFHRLGMHYSAMDFKQLLGDKEFDVCFRFTSIRNPFDRVLSYFRFITENKLNDFNKIHVRLAREAKSFEEFLINSIDKPAMKPVFNQHIYLEDQNGKMLIDSIVRYENLHFDLNKILKESTLKPRIKILFNEIIGNRSFQLRHINRSGFKVNYRDYYTTDSKAILENLSKTDLELFNYSF